MMTNTEAMQAMLAHIGSFKGMPMQNVQLANQLRKDGKPFTAPANQIWAKITISNAQPFIASIGNKPRTRTVGIIFIQLFAPLSVGTIELSRLADLWAEHMAFYRTGHLEMLEAGIINVGHSAEVGNPSSMNFYQYNVNVSYRVN